MIRIIRRSRAPLAVLAAAVLLLTGCGSGPNQAASAAIVGDRAISLDAVQGEIQWLLDNVPEAQQAQDQRKMETISRRVVQGRIVHELITVAAQREGLQVDRSQVEELINATGGVEEAARAIGAEPDRIRDVAADQVLLQQLGQNYLDRLSVDMVGTLITEEGPDATAKEQALELGRRIAADPAKAQAILGGNGQQVIDQQIGLAQAAGTNPELAVSALFGSSPGTVLVVQPSQQQAGWLVALVQDRTVTESAGQATGQQVDPQLLYGIGLRQLQPVAEDLGVRANPRYGVWDQAGVSLAASTEELTGHLLPARTVQP